MQAFDSVEIKADVEMGGTDQLFNLLAGRDLMDKMGMEPQVALTMPLLEGTDGVRKMSKSYGNYVGLTDAPADMYGKLMSIPDTMIGKYFRLASTLSVEEVDKIDAALADGSADPYELKRQLAANICDLYHGAGAGEAAAAEFTRVHSNRASPSISRMLRLRSRPATMAWSTCRASLSPQASRAPLARRAATSMVAACASTARPCRPRATTSTRRCS